MPTRDKAVAEVALRLGNRTDLDSKILNTMSYVQQYICERYPILPWFLVTEDLYTDTTSGEARLTVPTGFLREVENGALWRERSSADTDDRDWYELKKHPFDTMRAEVGRLIDSLGEPQHYALVGNYWRLAPIPDATYRIYTFIYQADTLPSALAAAGTNEWITHDMEVLVAETVLRMGQHLQYPSRQMSEFREARNEARRYFFTSQEARIHANVRYRQGIARGN